MAYRYGQDRNQMLFFPQSIDQYVAEDHPVRAYDAFVDTLDFEQLGIELDARKVVNSQIVHTDAVSDANDSHQLAKQVKAAQKVLDKNCQVACADSGYSDIEQMEKIESDKTQVIVPSKQQSSSTPPEPFSKSEFVYDKQHDCYRCPQGQRLIMCRFTAGTYDYTPHIWRSQRAIRATF